MSTWPRWLHWLQRTPTVVLDDVQRQRLQHWHALPDTDWQQNARHTRLLVVDVEASGLNLRRDKLISIGSVALQDGGIDPREAFEVVLRQQQVSSSDNILIHGISGAQQREGTPPAEALLQFLEYSGKAPLVAYHAFFDQHMIAAAMRHYLGLRYQPRWLDLAWLLPSLFASRQAHVVALDDWLQRFGIRNHRRHNAIADCLATAQLLQLALHRAEERGITTLQALAATERLRRHNNPV